jgi:hypothetical protein
MARLVAFNTAIRCSDFSAYTYLRSNQYATPASYSQEGLHSK